MKPSTLPAFALVAGLLWALGAPAQTATKPAAKPAAKAPAKASKASTKAAPAKLAAAEPVLARAEGEQLAAAALIHYGDYTCEFDQTVNVGVTPKHDGYVDVRHKAQTWTMKPVLSSTGALRLEDVKGQMLMLQIANKSMLMDAKLGQRVVDACVHEKQRLAIAAAASQPAGAGLLQAPEPVASAPATAAPTAAPTAASAPR